MGKQLLVALVVMMLTVACTIDTDVGLMEKTFDGDSSISEDLFLEVSDDQKLLEFRLTTSLRQGSITIYVHGPDSKEQYILALGATDSTETLRISNPRPGVWRLEIHVDGNSEQVVTGDVRLGLVSQ